MKNTLIYKSICVFVTMLFVLSCKNTDFDLQVNPNAASPAAANVEAVYNSIQVNFASAQFALEDQAGEVTRMYAATGGSNYETETQPTVFDGLWSSVYAGFLPDADLLEDLAQKNSLVDADIHRGSTKIMKAYLLMAMVDVFGNIPYSEAGQGLGNLNPDVDNGAVVYDSAERLLDEGIELLTAADDSAPKPGYDNFYNGDATKWIALANTLKLRSALNKDEREEFNDIIAADNFIKDAKGDFQFNYGSQRTNPNSRHPRYNNMYESSDGDYMPNYYMWLLAEDKTIEDATTGELIPQEDPRLRYYFFRKVSNSDRQNSNAYSCVLSDLPDQSKRPNEWATVDPRLLYCYGSTAGYFGRDHLNDSGIPPDGPIRTAYGLYPAGGDFDANDFVDTQKNGTTGGLGEGILPIMLSSYVDFMRAEMALREGNQADARMFLLAGVEKSFEKVESFESLVPGKMTSVREVSGQSQTVKKLYGISDDDIAAYKMLVGDRYDNATTGNPSAFSQLDVVMKEYFLAAYGNGLEAYNMYRRTGMPNNMQPPLQPGGAGNFPRSFRYANAFVDRNGTVDQKTESDLVFWDSGTTTLR